MRAATYAAPVRLVAVRTIVNTSEGPVDGVEAVLFEADESELLFDAPLLLDWFCWAFEESELDPSVEGEVD